MLKTIVIVVVLAILVVLAIAATQPRILRVQRSARVNAPADRIFPMINDFHRWTEWSPYDKFDPDMKRTFSGSALGKGAIYEWTGNNKVGAGRMEILEAAVPKRIAIKLDFIRPFEGHNVSEFVLEPNAGATDVTWAMEGPSAFSHRVMGLFMNMDKMIGKDFERGLENIRGAVGG